MMKQQQQQVTGKRTSRGFTLIEMMVAVTIFSVVMMVGVGALLSLVATNKRAQAIHSVMNNLNAALEGMSRSTRVGTLYNCVTSAAVPPSPPPYSTIAIPNDCATGGGKLLAFESATGNLTDPADQWVYRLNGTRLERSTQGGANGSWVAITAPEVSIDSFDFYVIGSSQADQTQPRVLMRILGSAQVPGGVTTFTVQASVVQRVLDI